MLKSLKMLVAKWVKSSFIVWHKWVARIFTIEILIHTGAWSVSLDDRVNEEFKELYVIGGTFAFIDMFFLCIQAILYLRRKVGIMPPRATHDLKDFSCWCNEIW